MSVYDKPILEFLEARGEASATDVAAELWGARSGEFRNHAWKRLIHLEADGLVVSRRIGRRGKPGYRLMWSVIK